MHTMNKQISFENAMYSTYESHGRAYLACVAGINFICGSGTGRQKKTGVRQGRGAQSLPVLRSTNLEVLQRTELTSIEIMPLKIQLHWAGHLSRIDDYHLQMYQRLCFMVSPPLATVPEVHLIRGAKTH